MSQLFANNASGTLSAQAEIIDTSLALQTNEGQLFPVPTGGDFFRATIEDTSGNIEIVTCTDNSNDVLTVTRAAESTTAKVFPAGSKVECRPTAGTQDSFLQKFGGVMSGTLDMDDNEITDPLIQGGEIRNAPIRGSAGATDNQIVVPDGGNPPTLGGNTIIHTGNDGAYALGATIFTAGDGLTGGGDLSTARSFDLDITTFSSMPGTDLLAADAFLVYDAADTVHKVIPYREMGIPIVDKTADYTFDDDDMNKYFTGSHASTPIQFDLDIGVGEKGNILIIEQALAAQITIAGTATLNNANGLKTFLQNSVISLVCTATDVWTVSGDATT